MNGKLKAKPGDKIKVVLIKQEYTGIFLESSESGIILIKLDSGYNIGFNKKDILDIEVLENSKEEAPLGVPQNTEVRGKKELSLKKDSGKPNIAMIITGGTIAARLNPKKGGVDWLDTPESFFKIYPGLFDKVNIAKLEIPFMKASEDMDFKDWQKIARLAEKLLNDSNIKGLIITHGTDFLHYTSAALSFFLRDLNKPVVLTYSQRSIDRASSDANLNLQCSALAAISDIAEVMLVGHASSNDDYCYAFPGTKVRKMHSSKRDAFKAVNAKPFARIFPALLSVPSGTALQGNKIERISDYNLRNKGKVKLDAKFEEKVALVKIYPGQDPDILDYYVKKKYKGIVLEMCGLGHAPTARARKSWIKKLKEVQKKGLIICAASQTIYGRLDPLVYSNGIELMNTGIIYLQDMLAETAFVKLGWVLGHNEWVKNKEIVKEKMLKNISHELNDRLEE
ncbi:MAG: Glu-tRNA(Gln) amidotransferase subunit GatD [Nanoarchaeota archaeon]|nr:Glu-tRNA(Gln) amidotransferase subunit GatD [Nanoarchaeota archaeon]MBU4116363.1 Glu-tRNA(Gln) amidotransferase subunit GatD [Nanoarchaeota archaeon]